VRVFLTGLLLLASAGAGGARERVYQGTWFTTNRPLEGTLTCIVTDLGGDRWRGKFDGEWQGRPFSYTVEFRGPPDKLSGEAKIDGADYQWTGEIDHGEFTGRFGGNRYAGSFNLKEQAERGRAAASRTQP